MMYGRSHMFLMASVGAAIAVVINDRPDRYYPDPVLDMKFDAHAPPSRGKRTLDSLARRNNGSQPVPGGGPRECARRRAQMARKAAKI